MKWLLIKLPLFLESLSIKTEAKKRLGDISIFGLFQNFAWLLSREFLVNIYPKRKKEMDSKPDILDRESFPIWDNKSYSSFLFFLGKMFSKKSPQNNQVELWNNQKIPKPLFFLGLYEQTFHQKGHLNQESFDFLK